jgi:hypothetical protein
VVLAASSSAGVCRRVPVSRLGVLWWRCASLLKSGGSLRLVYQWCSVSPLLPVVVERLIALPVKMGCVPGAGGDRPCLWAAREPLADTCSVLAHAARTCLPCSIKQLTKLLNDLAPAAVKEETLAELNGRKIAIDASMAIYQFLVSRQCGLARPVHGRHSVLSRRIYVAELCCAPIQSYRV